MVEIINTPELLISRRLGRRGYNEDDCKKIVESSRGGVIALQKRSVRSTSLRDFVGVKSC
ncbi:MAG: hypothetical protein Q7J85_04985 [Bacillota bacterium]|nr:hypothetical protein [Bacillota bacterium]